MLQQEQSALFDILGKTSTKDSDKFKLLEHRGWDVRREFDHRVLDGCHGYLLLECISGPVDAGDHDVVICKVADFTVDANSDGVLLYTAYLRERGLL